MDAFPISNDYGREAFSRRDKETFGYQFGKGLGRKTRSGCPYRVHKGWKLFLRKLLGITLDDMPRGVGFDSA